MLLSRVHSLKLKDCWLVHLVQFDPGTFSIKAIVSFLNFMCREDPLGPLGAYELPVGLLQTLKGCT